MPDDQTSDLLAWAESEGLPEADAKDIRGTIVEILTNKNLSAATKYSRISDAVVAELEKRGRFFSHQVLNDFSSAMFFDARRKILLLVQSDQFQSWLSQWLMVNRANNLFTYIVKAVENAALNGPATVGIVPEQYWASREGTIYISNGDGHMVKIIAKEFGLVDNGTDGVLFPFGKTLPPWELVEPVDPFESCSLFRDASCSPQGKDLLKLWAMSFPTDPKCKPPLVTTGVVGSGKTRVGRGVAELYGFPCVVAKADEAGEGNFWSAVNDGGMYIVDNADTRIRWVPDAMAAAATGGSFVKRRLYTDKENVQLFAKSWVMITSANPSFGSDAGLADRLLVVRMERRTGETSDAALSAEISKHRDAGLSYIANALALALADNSSTPKGLNARHPDFAAMAVRIGRAVGEEKAFENALRTAEADKAKFCVENDYIVSALLEIVTDEGEVSGTAAELVSTLRAHDEEAFKWLKARAVSNKLANAWPHIQKVFSAHKWTKHGGILNYKLTLREQFNDQQSGTEIVRVE